MMYLVIKDLSNTAQDVIMVTQSLIKDIQSNQETIYRANAIRALCLITDPSMIQAIERIIKACIVDKNPSVAAAALVSSYRVFNSSKDIVRRWAPEIQEAIQSKSASGGFASTASGFLSSFGSSSSQSQMVQSNSHIVQYHGLGLLYLIRQHDRVAIAKLVQAFFSTSGQNDMLKNPAAVCMLIRCACKVLEDDPGSVRRIYELLGSYLKHKSDMVKLEAARAICEMKDTTSNEIHPAISVLQSFLSSPKPTLRLASVRTLNNLALRKPSAVISCNLDIESLVSDSNRSIATIAITTLLKTANETSIDRLMSQISKFMGDASDEFKVIIVSTVHSLCIKFPRKQVEMLTFLGSLLRDGGGYDFKKTVVEAMFDIVHVISESKDLALSYLCEFIEDCEFTKLSVRILHLLGVEGPKTNSPTKYIRHIYNRVILENTIVRAAAVNALAKFGLSTSEDDVKSNIKVLLIRCQDDSDDEVRDRATLALELMKQRDSGKQCGFDGSSWALPILERELIQYIGSKTNEKAFDLSTIPITSKAVRANPSNEQRQPTDSIIPLQTDNVYNKMNNLNARQNSLLDQKAIYTEALSSVPEITTFGALLKSSKRVHVTETETEYVVYCVKHLFAKHIVFQFDCLNTLNDQLLENVEVVMDIDNQELGLVKVFDLPASKIEYNALKHIYVAYEKQEISSFPVASFSCKLKFTVKDCDPVTGEPDEQGYEDEYRIDNIELSIKDYIQPTYISEFEEEFNKLADGEVVQVFALDLKKAPNLQVACTTIINLFGLQPLQDSSLLRNPNIHTLIMSGTFLTGKKILAKCRMMFNSASGAAFELSVRSEDIAISEVALSAIK
ncbi:hypothetical protein RO3G_10502 [Rhizopus delemar RA 99-880]|uniref:Coatomer subunit gamma n=1 Tax=Rhizopus delemar (strain RA 99-880 / ATCC MYA-4621 / FGSC 9543 / NRRL 43880) TaxID=246409 RepID=I1CBG2_RHIO9|nr:hypothetical protein RO3G_10502 [Rhizopus delemar RA 99-880]|eukprot:EIE85792.1 hypothetical protein RO3G_10502 [Rhizopus delemar RA 99-880]